MTSAPDPQASARPDDDDNPIRPDWLDHWRDRVARVPGGLVTWRIGITAIGLLIVFLGIILLALPGPGWLVIFVGLGVWATEFEWAGRLLTWVRGKVTGWTRWALRQRLWVRLLIGAVGLIFLACLAVLSLSIL